MNATEETPGASTTPARPKARTTRGPRKARAELTPAQRELTEQYLPLAMSLARPVKLKWTRDRDELDAAARLALVEAAQAFDPRRGVKFPTFARARIMGALYDAQRHMLNKIHSRELPNGPKGYRYVPGGEESGALMLTSRDPDVGAEVDAIDEVERWLGSLPPRHALACRELYLAGRTQGEAAQALGCVKSRVCTLHAEALEMLRNSPAVRAAALAVGLDVGRN
jgi:RNA polymerase sigma factor (sigma-70 family)